MNNFCLCSFASPLGQFHIIQVIWQIYLPTSLWLRLSQGRYFFVWPQKCIVWVGYTMNPDSSILTAVGNIVKPLKTSILQQVN